MPDAKTSGSIAMRCRMRVWWRICSSSSTIAGRRLQSIQPRGGYLARQGYIARGGQILDASIVPVPRNHNTRDGNKAIKASETPEDWADKPAKLSQKDTDVLWTKKHGKSHYGYKNHVNVDRKHKLVRRYHVSRSRDIAAQCPAGQWVPPCTTVRRSTIC
jgi:hypothetical protein